MEKQLIMGEAMWGFIRCDVLGGDTKLAINDEDRHIAAPSSYNWSPPREEDWL
jgi:hypothetical protein